MASCDCELAVKADVRFLFLLKCFVLKFLLSEQHFSLFFK